MTYVTKPGDFIDRVTPQNGDRVLFEWLGHVEAELAKPAAAARAATAASHFTHAPSLQKQLATWDSKAEVQDDSKHITEADQVLGSNPLLKWMWTLHLSNKKSQHKCTLKERNCERRTHRYEHKKPLKESKLVQTKFVFAKIWRRRRWSRCHDSMLIMLSLRFERDTSLPTLEAHETRPGYDETNQSSF